jgi:hypothetical protein
VKQRQGDCNALDLDSNIVVGTGDTDDQRRSGTTSWHSSHRER